MEVTKITRTEPVISEITHVTIEFTIEEATELATIFHYLVSGHWRLRYPDVGGGDSLINTLAKMHIEPRADWRDTRLPLTPRGTTWTPF